MGGYRFMFSSLSLHLQFIKIIFRKAIPPILPRAKVPAGSQTNSRNYLRSVSDA